MKLKELNGKHIGKRITIAAPNSSASGMLVGIDHECDLVDVTTMGDAMAGVSRYVPGSQHVGITIQGWGERIFPADDECAIEAV